MLLSLFKIVFFIVIITLVALCITYLLDNEQTFLGEVFINIGTTEFTQPYPNGHLFGISYIFSSLGSKAVFALPCNLEFY